MNELLALLSHMRWQDVVDIALVAFVIYHIILLLRGTRAMQMLLGLGIILLILVVSQQLDLLTINWIINSFLSSLLLVVIIVFQSDIRRALTRLGRGTLVPASGEAPNTLEEVVRASVTLASRMIGALIVIERRTGLAEYVESGTEMDALVSRELLISLFQPGTPLHDGAIIISGDRIKSARSVLPLSTSPQAGRQIGTRHRAALGLSEESDAVCVVVSEERGRVSVAVGGKLTWDLEATALRNLLFELCQAGPKRRRRFFWLRSKIA
jgi:diadenylate cyclase